MTTTPDLPPKLEAVLIRLGRAASLNVTQAVKLPYIVDLVAVHVLGRRITEASHEAWDKGVVASEAWHYMTKCEDSTSLHLEPVPFSEEKKLVVDAEADDGALTPDEAAIVDAVAEGFAHIRAADLGRLTKLVNPDITAWGSNQPGGLTEDAYERLDGDYQAMAEAVSRITLEQLAARSERIESIEDAVA